VRYTSLDKGNRTEILEIGTPNTLSVAALTPTSGEPTARAFTATAADGSTRLYGAMILPPDFDEHRSYPLIDYLYPGPQVAHRPQAFGSMHLAQAHVLAELGFIVVMFDTRGVPLRSRELHQRGYGSLLEPQLADHAAVVRELCTRHPFIDADRVGVLGASAGGAASARALFDYGDLFKVGVSVCGCHDPDTYCAPWSEKYRGPDASNLIDKPNTQLAHQLRGKLLLIHGDLDENVPVSQTLALADALIHASKDFDLLIVPNEGHGVLLTSGYAQRRVWDYFVCHLLGQTPPPDFELHFDSHEIARCLERFSLELQ